MEMSEINASSFVKRILWIAGKNLLFVDEVFDKNFQMSSSNKFSVDLIPDCGINVYDIIRHESLIITKSSLKKLEERLLAQ